MEIFHLIFFFFFNLIFNVRIKLNLFREKKNSFTFNKENFLGGFIKPIFSR
jgi:hypothetical protein